MKHRRIFAAAGLLILTAFQIPSFAQSPAGLTGPSRSELESVIGGLDLTMGEKLSLRKVLQSMQEQGDKVRADGTLSDAQKVSQIVKVRQSALDQTAKFLTPEQQSKMVTLLLPKS